MQGAVGYKSGRLKRLHLPVLIGRGWRQIVTGLATGLRRSARPWYLSFVWQKCMHWRFGDHDSTMNYKPIKEIAVYLYAPDC